MYNNKKGISDVVSTVLIILLVVAAVAIIGAIIINVVGKSGAGVNSAVACQQLQLKPTACTTNVADGSPSGIAQLVSLPASTTLSNVSLVFAKANEETTVGSATTVPSSVGATSAGTTGAGTSANAGDFKTMSVGAELTLSDGTKAVCAPTSETVVCA